MLPIASGAGFHPAGRFSIGQDPLKTGPQLGKLPHSPTGAIGKIESVPLVPLLISNRSWPYEAEGAPSNPSAGSAASVLSRIAKLASNENPLGASPSAIEAMTTARLPD